MAATQEQLAEYRGMFAACLKGTTTPEDFIEWVDYRPHLKEDEVIAEHFEYTKKLIRNEI